MNFDGAFKGNPGLMGYGFLIRDQWGAMKGFGYGFLGRETNNTAEFEGLLQGLVWAMANFSMLMVVEGDLQLLINMENNYKVALRV